MCFDFADTVAREIFRIGRTPRGPNELKSESANDKQVREKLQGQLNGTKLAEVMGQLKRCPAGLDKSLANTIGFGVSYHHAGTLVCYASRL